MTPEVDPGLWTRSRAIRLSKVYGVVPLHAELQRYFDAALATIEAMTSEAILNCVDASGDPSEICVHRQHLSLRVLSHPRANRPIEARRGFQGQELNPERRISEDDQRQRGWPTPRWDALPRDG
jgi:hypothetical protein